MTKHLHTIRNLILFLLSFLLFNFSAISQSEKCAFDHIYAKKMQDPNFVKMRAEMEKFIKRYSKNKSDTRSGVALIPCVVHVVHTGQGPGTIDNDQSGNNDGANPNDAQILSAINNMTDAFKHTGPYAGLNGYTASMNVTFVLAKTAPDGTATTGILRHNVSGESWGTDYANNGMDAGQTPGVPQATITAGKFWPPMDYMNIWIVHEVENATTTLGFASFPNANPGGTDGLTMLATAFGYDPNCGTGSALPGSILDCGTNLNGTANHETGHYLNLFHTFTGDNGGTSCPADATCGTDSDCCPDIPAHKRTSGCPADNPTGNDCPSPGSGPNSYIHNFMDYADDACFHGFSENQKTRMEAALNGPRIALCLGIGYSNPSGSYPIAVSAPTVTNPDQSMGIYDVSLNGKTHKSWSSHFDGGYVNRVGSVPRITLAGSMTYSMSVQVGVGNPSNNELVNVYIDYNNNGDFTDPGEELFVAAGGSGKKNGESFTFNFTTPSTPIGQGLRMRIISDFDSGTSLTATHNPSDGGQVEDYTIEMSMTVPVEFVDFRAEPMKDEIMLNWEVASQINNEAFEIERMNNSTGEFETIGSVKGEGTYLQNMDYTFYDKKVQSGVSYYYRLKQIDFSGTFEYSDIRNAKIEDNRDSQLSLFPNPATNDVNIKFGNNNEGVVQLNLYSFTGEIVKTSNISIEKNGLVVYDLTGLESGIYLLQSISDYDITTTKLIIGN